MRTNTLLLINVLAIVPAMIALAVNLRSDESKCSCGPDKNGTPHNVQWRITNPNNVDQSHLQTALTFAGATWVDAFAHRSTEITVGPGSGDLEVIITDDLHDQAEYLDNKLWIASDTLTGSQDYLNAIILHEMGHDLGFAQAPCPNTSVMSDTTSSSYRTALTACDLQNMTYYYGAVRRDDDNDGFSPDDAIDHDCDDTRNDIYPGAPISCDAALQEPSIDADCNGMYDWDQLQCNQYYNEDPTSPVIVDVLGNGFDLTDRSGGVLFDLGGTGAATLIPWTAANTDDSWLVLDRNGNGLIDSGAEMFGNFTPQPAVPDKNGFLALAQFDSNADGWIDSSDPIYTNLRLWRDASHDGISQATELATLASTGIRRISLRYHEDMRVDRWGNWFRYAARVIDDRNRDVGPIAYDVFLGQRPPKHR